MRERRRILCLEPLRRWLRKRFSSCIPLDKSNDVPRLSSVSRARSSRSKNTASIATSYLPSNAAQTARNVSHRNSPRQSKSVVSYLRVV